MKPFRKFMFFLVIALLCGPLSCQREGEEARRSHDTAPESRKLNVLTTIAPLYSFTVNVAGGAANVENLLPSGAGPHEYSLSPSDMIKISSADVIIKNGVRLESWLNRAIKNGHAPGRKKGEEKEGRIVADTSRGVDIIEDDPHIWLSPRNAIVQVRNIRDALVEADPANEDRYRENAGKYIERLEDLDMRIRERTKRFSRREFVAFHPAFRYLARDYGLVQAAAIREHPETEPSPAHVAEVVDTIRRLDLNGIFTEKDADYKVVRMLAEDLDIGIYHLDTLETGELSPGWYEKAMTANFEALTKVLGDDD